MDGDLKKPLTENFAHKYQIYFKALICLEPIAWEGNWTILKDCQIYRYFIRMDLEIEKLSKWAHWKDLRRLGKCNSKNMLDNVVNKNCLFTSLL